MPLKALFYDLDGTLGDTLPVTYVAFRATFERFLGQSPSDEAIHELFGPTDEGILRDRIPANRADEALAFYLERQEAALREMAPEPFEGLREVLGRLAAAGVTQGVITGKGPRSLEMILREWKLANFFRTSLPGSPDGNIKPQRLREAMAEWELEPGETVYAGDSPSDITDARSAGVFAVAAAWAPGARREDLLRREPDKLFTNVHDFAEWALEAASAGKPSVAN
ncbi:MAG: HAD hydrolase-like protein [Sumerlaeia bacterium]